MSELLQQPHHDGSGLYVSNPNPHLGETVTVSLRVPHHSAARSVHVRVTPDGEQQFVKAAPDLVTDAETWWRADIVCRNPVTNYRFILEGGAASYAWVNGTGVHERDVPDSSDFRIVSHEAAPAWAQDAIVYQIFIDRFDRGVERPAPAWAAPADWSDPVDISMGGIGRQWFGGDLEGVRNRLDYIAGLGVNVLYLTPFFPARSNHRYDAATFDSVDPVLGGDEALDALVEAAHARGIRIMGDLTTNHTGDSHEWFRRAGADTDSVEREFYFFDALGEPETWLGVSSLPKLNFGSDALRSRFFSQPDGVVARWLGRHRLDGWRIDVANMTGRLREQDLNAEVARLTRGALSTANPEALLIAEHAHDYSRDAEGDGWHGVMNYAGFTKPVWTWLRDPDHAPEFLGSPLRVPRLGAREAVATMRDFAAQVPWTVTANSFNLLGSHDTTRIRTLVGAERRLVEVAAGLLFTLPGIPMFTYGDEIGMRGRFGEDGRRPYPWDGIGAETDTLACYRELAALHASLPALRHGGLRFVHADGDAIVFLRESPGQRVLVHCARAAHGAVAVDSALFGAVSAVTAHGRGPALRNNTFEFTAAGPEVNVSLLQAD